MAELIELDDDGVLEQLDELSRMDTARLAAEYSPETVARVLHWMKLELSLRSLPREDALAPDFAFRVAERVGVVESPTSERTLAAAGLTLMTGGGIGVLAWLARASDAIDLAGEAGLDLGALSNLAGPIMVGVAVVSIYGYLDRHLPGLLRKG